MPGYHGRSRRFELNWSNHVGERWNVVGGGSAERDGERCAWVRVRRAWCWNWCAWVWRDRPFGGERSKLCVRKSGVTCREVEPSKPYAAGTCASVGVVESKSVEVEVSKSSRNWLKSKSGDSSVQLALASVELSSLHKRGNLNLFGGQRPNIYTTRKVTS